MEKGNIVSLEDRIPKLKQRRKKKANRRAIMLLSLFFLLLILVLYFLSPLSNVSKVGVSGNRYLSKEVIVSVSGITKETSIWKLDKTSVKNQLEALPEIKKATISLVMPNSIHITIQEYNRLAYLVKESKYYPILSSGELLDPLEKGEVPVLAPMLIGYKEGNELKSVIEALDALPADINNAISEIHHEPTKTDAYHLRIYMNDGYEVSATSRTMADKLVHYPSIVSQLDSTNKGVINLEVGSFFIEYGSNVPEQSGEKGSDGDEKDESEE